MTVADWASLLKRLSAQKVAFINTTSSSGAFLPAVAAPGRTVVTATKTGGERNEAMFGEFFVEAFGDTRPMPTATATCRCSRPSITRTTRS